MIIAGYITILGYVFALIFLLGPLVVKAVNGETSRKITHTMLFMVWVLIDLFFRDTVHQILIPILFLILNALSYKFKIYKSVEREDNNHLGTVYFAAAITVVMTLAYFFPALYYPSGVASFCLTFGDGFAALVGYNFESRKLRENKSLLGFAACFAACAVSLTAFRAMYWEALTLPAIVLLSAVAAITELTGGGLDNFAVTFSTFALSYLMTDRPSDALFWGLGLAVVIFLVVFLSKSISYYGSLLAMVMVFCFTYFGGTVGISFLLLNYFSIFAIGLLRRKRLAGSKEKQGRGFLQILINGGLGTVLVVLAGIRGSDALLAAAMISIGGNFIDSVSSDVGTLSPRQPYDLLRREKVERGLSGGVTWLGTLSAMAFSVAIGVFIALTMGRGVVLGALCAGLVMLQSVVDTILGSTLQVKYRCEACGVVTESKTHCNRPAACLRGLKWLDNNAVNAISSLLITGLAAALTGVML